MHSLLSLDFLMYIEGAFSEGIPHISKDVLNIELEWKGGGEHLSSKLDMWQPLQNSYVKGDQNI